VTPLDRVGVYAPGGKAAYPSSVLMAAVPARAAGVREVVLATPAPGGNLNPVVLAAADVAGVDRVFRIGGAQAIAALAYGTRRVPRVDKIVGPGNLYVATAKRLAFGEVGIDTIAGPTEILILADGSANPDWVAADLISQAEHDEAARAVLISTSRPLLEATRKALIARASTAARRSVAEGRSSTRGARRRRRRWPTATRRSISRSPWRGRRSGCGGSATRGPSSWGTGRASCWAISWRGRTTCCLRPRRRDSPRPWGRRIS
jgi:histidinol dehydrogenase